MKWLNVSRIKRTVCAAVVGILAAGAATKADFTFGEPINLGPPVNSGYSERHPSVSHDGLELYFGTDRASDPGTEQLWVAKRPTPEDPWAEPYPLGPEINSEEQHTPHISPDGLELYFTGVRRPGGYGNSDIWVSRRSALNAPWGAAVNLGPLINSSDRQFGASITADGLELFFARREDTLLIDASFSIWSARRATREDPWGEPERLGALVNSSGNETAPCISADGLFLCFSSAPSRAVRPGGQGGPDIWVTTRPTRDAPWRSPWNPGPPLSTAYFESNPSISADGRWLYFSDSWWNSEQECRPGGYGSDDLWKAPIIPIVDFNGDGIVDIKDLLRLIESWGKNDPSVDMGPMPWGDGKVDAKDLGVLMSYWGQEPYDPALIARWRLDEAEGSVAADSAGTCDGTLVSDPLWQPTGGKLGGALLLDGIDDHLTTGYVRDPADGPFSVFAWVKGGALGQVILSQDKGANWLVADGPDGVLATELKSSGRTAKTLQSTATITDGVWHRVGLTWDGSNRTLYVDDAEVVRDTQSSLTGTYAGLYIGAGKALEPGTFWSGLIDDVRIYNRAIKP